MYENNKTSDSRVGSGVMSRTCVLLAALVLSSTSTIVHGGNINNGEITITPENGVCLTIDLLMVLLTHFAI